ncbi:ABC transporter transmembrane region 2-domain-containing protein [Baffinella frigidus]|nr:ABC transporter transmembrane region 2-domain-containing protein [Cryptophyta sp. CCMP2293]
MSGPRNNSCILGNLLFELSQISGFDGYLTNVSQQPYFEEEKNARVLIAIVLTFTFLNAGISVGFSYLSRDFWTALNSKDSEVFYPLLTKYAFFLAAGTPVGVLYKYYREKLSIQWRSWITKRILDTYEADRNYYILESTSNIDNPDQRMAEDLRSFTQVSLAFAISFVTSVIDLFSFSTILWSIYPPLWGAILVYAGFGTAGTLLIGNKLVGLNFEQLQREADFRFSLIRVRENAESIAFYGGEQIEMREIKRRLDKTIDNAIRLVGQQRNLEFFTTGYRYMVQIVPSIVVAPLYFQSKIELGVVSQSYGAFNHILNDLSIIINQFENIASFGAGIGRLGDFVDAMKISAERQERLTGGSSRALGVQLRLLRRRLVRSSSSGLPRLERPLRRRASTFGRSERHAAARGGCPPPPSPISSQTHNIGLLAPPVPLSRLHTEYLRVKGAFPTLSLSRSLHWRMEQAEWHAAARLRLFTPDGSRELLRDLDLEMQPGQHLLIVGDSGAGKSSLLRAVAGLWSTGSGHITRPPPGETFFLPQRPCCTLGTHWERL